MSEQPQIPEELEKILEGATSIDQVLDRLIIEFYKPRIVGRGRPSIGKSIPGYALVWYYYRKLGNKWRKIAEEIYKRAQLINIPQGIRVFLVSPDTIEARVRELLRNEKLLNTIKTFWEKLPELIKLKRRGKDVLWIDLTVLPMVKEAFMKGDRKMMYEILKKATNWETVASFLAQQRKFEAIKYYSYWLARVSYYLKNRMEGKSIEESCLCGTPEAKPYYAPDINEFELADIRRWVEECLDSYINECGYTSDTVRVALPVLRAISNRVQIALKDLHTKYKVKGKKKNDMHIAFEDEIKYFIEHYKELGFSDFEALVILTHITLGCREGQESVRIGGKVVQGGLLGLDWSNVHWDEIDGEMLPIAIDVWESKVGERGIWWRNCRLDLFFGKLVPRMLKRYWVKKGKPRSGKIFDISYTKLRRIHLKFRKYLNWYRKQFKPERPISEWTPHDSRRTHAYLLIVADVPFEVIAGGLKGENIDSPLGVLWLTDITLVEYYQGLERKALKYVDVVRQRMSEIFGVMG